MVCGVAGDFERSLIGVVADDDEFVAGCLTDEFGNQGLRVARDAGWLGGDIASIEVDSCHDQRAPVFCWWRGSVLKILL